MKSWYGKKVFYNNDLGVFFGVDMGIYRRTFGEVVEWIWGSLQLKQRTFGEVVEWIWGLRGLASPSMRCDRFRPPPVMPVVHGGGQGGHSNSRGGCTGGARLIVDGALGRPQWSGQKDVPQKVSPSADDDVSPVPQSFSLLMMLKKFPNSRH